MPNIGEINEENYLSKQEELMDLLNTKVKKTEKLTQRFEDFHASHTNTRLFCGVS